MCRLLSGADSNHALLDHKTSLKECQYLVCSFLHKEADVGPGAQLIHFYSPGLFRFPPVVQYVFTSLLLRFCSFAYGHVILVELDYLCNSLHLSKHL